MTISLNMQKNTAQIRVHKRRPIPIILARSGHWRKLVIRETLMIEQRNPDLNSDKAAIPLYLFNV